MSRQRCNTKMLRHLIQARGPCCELCGRDVVCVSLIAPKDRLRETAAMLLYRTINGEYIESAKATVEHVRPRAAGGTSNANNVLLSCWFCNQARNRQQQRVQNDGPPYLTTSLGPLLAAALQREEPSKCTTAD